MKLIPILFSTPMVQAILKDRKSQTRRIIRDTQSLTVIETFNGKNGCENICPYGFPGDILWVRESWSSVNDKFVYKADTESNYDKPTNGWKPSIHMPKAACRLFLHVDKIRVERLQDISGNDCIAEGVYPDISTDHPKGVYYTAYRSLWEKINGPDSWNTNPWVWVIRFHRVERPANFLQPTVLIAKPL